jgi:excinuclease UvrABC ATPase subunit
MTDLGPEGGSAGGEVLFEGRPSEIGLLERSITGKFLGRQEVAAVPS